MTMIKNNHQNFFTANFLELLLIMLLFLLVLTVDARLRENNAEIAVSCDDSAMNVRMMFKYPFKGIVFIPEHYYDPACSYGVSPNSSALEVTLTLPHDSCKMRILNSGNMLIGSNIIVVFHHRMLETVYDYTQNITCELKYPIKDLNKNIWREPVLKTWLSFENPPSVLPEEFVDKMGLEDVLLLVYHVKDRGVHRDMMVMNCIGHDANIINERTRFYQLSNPLGCSNDSDLVSNFTVFRDPIGRADMIAYAVIKDFSMVIRRRLYITCGAQICKDRCERKCGEINPRRSFYFSDIVSKGLVNRAEGSKRPASLTAFERFDRQRRSHEDIKLLLQSIANDGTESLFETIDTQSMNETTEDVTNIMPVSLDLEEHARSKRAVKQLKTEVISSGLHVIVIKSDATVNMVPSRVRVQSTTKSDIEISVSKNSSDLYETNSVLKVKMKFEPQQNRINRDKESDRFNFNSFLRAMIAIVALICISGACYSLFSCRNRPDTVSVSNYASQNYI